MYTSISETEKLRHPYYQIMELKNKELQLELNTWSRLELIDWLCWNDRNGIYRDEDSISEMDNILGRNEAIEIMSRQILENQ
ncbi:hypothetical protein [Olleya sp. Bg11-27]|uniref:Uncharacterized protein n=1 Tax=Olleya namhaensis TaxID=1144750 RepID=A0A1I3IPN1_9FLAO|nr:hypothetical protein [Olleya sp. Bg11-27]AUC74319.1 hypothetical protein CW732_00950 [Olleya sp. Bg11-27]SFI49945.1 hypothetical protein SAMN05443431_10158 [Olleya namhaensis]